MSGKFILLIMKTILRIVKTIFKQIGRLPSLSKRGPASRIREIGKNIVQILFCYQK